MHTLEALTAAKPVIGRRVIICKGQEREWLTPVEQLKVGDTLRILPGERIPLDGVIVQGASCVSRHVVSEGAHLLETKQQGDKVYCGTINAAAAIEMRVTADWRHSGFEQRLELAREELDKQSLLVRLWRRVTSSYRPSYN